MSKDFFQIEIPIVKIHSECLTTVEANLKIDFKEDERDYKAVEFILKDIWV